MTRRSLLIQAILIQWLGFVYFASPPPTLPAGWWEQGSAESTLAKAESITHDLSYLRGTEAHLLKDHNSSIEFFQRKNPDGTIETKSVKYGGRMTTSYKLTSGEYFFANGRLIKFGFKDNQIEPSLAAQFDHPYDYNMLKPTIVGTNDCLIVARIATPRFLQTLVTAYYPENTSGNPLLGDLKNYIRSETDTYIRKSDGVIIGEVKKNKSGDILDDKLYDVVQVNDPIPSEEFILPKARMETATNTVQFLKILTNGKHADNLLNSREIKRIRFVIIGVMVISLGVLFYIFIRFHRRKTTG